ncbi:hypothetical protein [Mesorhizobium sp. SP-1A]|uniref:hypothetical protein n=1 Tax=Mesorhizobium sp. SP-1A TaxID=3077840 RepID=UPI0028F73F33|nr:hypothetical protein [Mesorhizobium sp. SP-1A]
MRVRIPYTFTAHVVPLKKIKEINSTEGDWLTADLKEVDDLDAPIATEWTDFKGETFQTRWHDGSHWLIHKIYDEDQNYQLLSPDILSDMLENGNARNPLSVGAGSSLRELISGEIKPFDKANFKTVKETEQEAVIRRIHDQIADCIIVENQVWKRCGEPYYRFNRLRVEKQADGRVMRYPEVELLPKDGEIYRAHEAFSADQFEDYVDFATGNFHDAIFVPEEFKITVLVPESISFNSEVAALHSTVGDFLTATAGDLAKKSTDFIRSWANLKDGFELATAQKSEQANDTLVELAKIVVEISPNKSEYNVDNLFKTTERWNTRNISLDFDVTTTI